MLQFTARLWFMFQEEERHFSLSIPRANLGIDPIDTLGWYPSLWGREEGSSMAKQSHQDHMR